MTAAPIRLLMIEDSAGDARLLQETLADQAPGEFAITTAERLADALARIQAERFDAVLCDLGLPDSTGLGTAQAIIAAAPALPLIVLTGSHDTELGRAAIELGAQDYLVKGETRAPTIARTLRYAIERKRLENQLHDANEALERRVAERTAELEAALTKLHESLSRARALAETATDAIIIADQEGTIVAWNPAAERLFGYTRAEARGQALTLVIPERYRGEHWVGVKRVLADGERHLIGRTVEFHGLTKAGSEFPLELSVSTWETSEGRMFSGIIRDVTERKRTQDALRAAGEQYRGLVEQSITGIYIIQDDRFAYVNPRFAEILGYGSADELIGRDLLSVVAEKHRGVVAENIRRRLEGEVRSADYGFAALRKDGSTVEVGVHGARATHGGRPAIIGLMQDISEKKRAEAQIQRYIEQLKTAFMSTVQVTTTLSEMRDPYTAGHERRVAEIAVAIGTELGFDARRQEGLRVAGFLHDIGKITVPTEILSKPGKLSPVELKLIQGHPRASYDVLKDVEFPWPVAEIALQHHERMDGSGYPQGLKGEAILLDARVIAVADVVEAMSSHRPYRAALGINKALAEIERGRGTAYDPSVADACLKLFREKSYAIPA